VPWLKWPVAAKGEGDREGVVGVHAQAERATVDLGGADPQQLDQKRVEARCGGGLLRLRRQGDEGLVGGRVLLADVDALGVGHDSFDSFGWPAPRTWRAWGWRIGCVWQRPSGGRGGAARCVPPGYHLSLIHI